MDPGIQIAELLAYSVDETNRWKRWLRENPAALDLAYDVAGAGTVRNLLFHVFATELFFATRVLGLPKIDFETLPSATLDQLFAVSEEAQEKFQRFLRDSSPEEWASVQPLGFGDLKASKRKMVVQAIWHGIHHRGQLATFLRQQGFKQDWTHDFILSPSIE
jgi:uncharacterized damage-inducible protein DinB